MVKPLLQSGRKTALQRELLRLGQFIPEVVAKDPADLAQSAHIQATSELRLSLLPADGPLVSLQQSWAQMLPVRPGPMPSLTFPATVTAPTTLLVELRTSDRTTNHNARCAAGEAGNHP